MSDAIIKLDPKVFSTAEDAQLVLECLPTEEEQGLLTAYLESGKPAEMLSEAEQLAVALMRTPRCAMRLSSFYLRHAAAERQGEARQVRIESLAWLAAV